MHDGVRKVREWTTLSYVEQKEVCKWMQEEALDMLATDGEDHDFAACLEAAAHHLGRKATVHERSRQKQFRKRQEYKQKLAERFGDFEERKP